ncbi:MAG: FHA domain-containing protein [Acaryochloridaceae cyanobacterium SU_2_1]|nr:FHA domain-containing protein [Acaryochloridaceae cyanobacterium SU_2_1]
MSELTLQWSEFGQLHRQVLFDQQQSKHAGTIRLGRDPALCDVVFQERSVSGLHAEIFFQAQTQQFLIRNLRPQNAPLVDGRLLPQGEVPLRLGSRIQLGRIEMQVTHLNITAPVVAQNATPQPLQSPLSTAVYGLQCPQCQHVTSYSSHAIHQDCPMCGHAMADAHTVFKP